MSFREITSIYQRERAREGIIARLHTGDLSFYSTLQEQVEFCERSKIEYRVIPGVSSLAAATACLAQELTLPGVSQSVIISRVSGRTRVPPAEQLEKLAASGCTLVLFLSIGEIESVVEKLSGCYAKDTPAAVVYRSSWPEERIIRGRLENIAEQVLRAGIERQALIFVGWVLDREFERSSLYDEHFSHGFRHAGKKEQPEKEQPEKEQPEKEQPEKEQP
jgi:precorrin-4/cobalt-precorrin-4 C11-methyltransferase